LINEPFLFDLKGMPREYRAALQLAIERGWLWKHESGTYVNSLSRRGAICLMKCTLCEDSGWVCEDHPDAPWDGEHACICGAAGMHCPKCKPSDLSHPPRPPAGTHIEFDKKGWRH
jgi:hypothetical protein